MTGQIILKKDGVRWDRARFTQGNQLSMGAAMCDVLSWRDKILREEPDAKISIKVKFAN